MSIAIMEDAPSPKSAPILRAELLARIHALNADYLELLAGGHGGDPGFAPSFPPRFAAALAQMTREARLRIAAVPYTLFSLCFSEVRFWRAVCAPQQTPLAMRYGSVVERGTHAAFCEVALIEAWHLARAQPRAAQVLHAMSPEVAVLLAGVPLWQIKRIAQDYPGLLAPRWPNNPAFWPDLLRLSGGINARPFAAARLLGVQLIAAELAVATRCTGARGPFKPRLRPQLAPRVRGRLHP